jgi:iron complex transport system ATP-binding protein
MTSAYEVRDLRVRRDGRDIIDGISLDIGRGTVLALVGPNGAGKSTLLGALSGDLRPSAGSIRFLGQELRSWAPRVLARHRSILLQANEVSFAFTVRQVVEMGRSPWWGADDVAGDERFVAEALERTDTTHLLDRAFSSLSGGEKARVSLARVLAQNAEVVLLDEPTAALDLRHQEEVMALTRDLAAQGRSVIVVVHDLSLAAAFADDIALLDQGALVALGPPTDVLTPVRVGQVYRTEVVVHRADDQLVILPRRTRT